MIKGLKIIGFRILSDTNKRFKKHLNQGEVYKFYQNYLFLDSNRNETSEENEKLAELQDWLLPMLMNGQVKVK